MNTLNSERNLSKNPHLVASKTELGTLEVGHLEANITDKTVVHK